MACAVRKRSRAHTEGASMNEKKTNRSQEVEIDLSRLANAVMNKSWLVGIVAVV